MSFGTNLDSIDSKFDDVLSANCFYSVRLHFPNYMMDPLHDPYTNCKFLNNGQSISPNGEMTMAINDMVSGSSVVEVKNNNFNF